MLFLSASSLVSGDIQKDVRVAPVLGRWSSFYSPSVHPRMLYHQYRPSMKISRRISVPSPFSGPFGQFTQRRMIHPIHRDRLRFFALQKNLHIDLTRLSRASTAPLRENTSAESFISGQTWKSRCHELSTASCLNVRNCALTKSSGNSEESS